MNKFLLIISFFNVSIIYAQSLDSIQKLDEILITGTKYPISKKYSGKIITKLTKEEIAQSPQKSVAQWLDEVMGFEINGSNSALGKNIGTYVNGGKSGQVLIILDGIPVIDPSGIDMSYDLNMLSAGQIESIEVMRGAAGTLYGSGAATAVINIKSIENSSNKIAVEFGSTLSTQRSQNSKEFGGSHWLQNMNINGKLDKFNYLLSYSGSNSDGFSEAFSPNNNFKANSFDKQQTLVKVGYNFTEKFNVGLTGNYSNVYHQFDQNAFADSDVNEFDKKEFKLALHSKYEHKKGNFQWNSEYKKADRNLNQYNSWTMVIDDYLYKTNSFQSDLFHLFQWTENVDIISGLNFQFHQTDNATPYGNISKDLGKFNSFDPYINVNFKDINGFNFAVGGRYNIHSEYGAHATFSANPSYVFEFDSNRSLKLMSSLSTAYIVPSLFQLFSNYGNLDLTPETTKSLEFGLDYSIVKKFNFTALYFIRNEKNTIIFVSDPVTWVSKYENDKSGVIKVSGFESGVSYSPISKLDLKTNYTFTKTSKERPYSIPKHKWNAKAQYKLSEKTKFLLSYQYTSDRTQMDFSSYPYSSKQLENYHLLNLGLTQNLLNNKLTLNVSVDNLFNADYVEIIGYSTLGRNYSVSFKYKL